MENPGEDGQVVAERLARGGGRNNHRVLPRGHTLKDVRLVAVQTLYAARMQGVAQFARNRARDFGVRRLSRRDQVVEGDPGAEVGVTEKTLEDLDGAHRTAS